MGRGTWSPCVMTPWMKNTLSSDCVVEASPTTPPQLEKKVTSLKMVGGVTSPTSLRVGNGVTNQGGDGVYHNDVPSPLVGRRTCVEVAITTPPHVDKRVTSPR